MSPEESRLDTDMELNFSSPLEDVKIESEKIGDQHKVKDDSEMASNQEVLPAQQQLHRGLKPRHLSMIGKTKRRSIQPCLLTRAV